jgi:membrane protease YdiL (CAAX protease family)/uncharacterized RDD family membrane protein YckC
MDSAVWIVGLLFYNPLAYVSLSRAAAGIIGIVILSLWFNYFAFCEWRWGQTIGKNAFGLRVLPLDGGKLTWQAAALRNLLRLIDFPLSLIGIDYFIYERSPRRQRLGDKAAKTVVVMEPPKTAPPPAGSEPLPSNPPPAATAQRPDPLPPVLPPPEPPYTEAAAEKKPGLPFATWGLGRTIAGMFLGLALAIFLPLLALPFGKVGDNGDATANIIAQLLSEIGFFAAAVWIAATAAPKVNQAVQAGLRRLGYRPFRPSAIGWVGVGFVAYFLFLVVYIAVIGKPHQKDIADDFGPVVFQILLISIVAPIAEETFFRGMLFGGLRVRMPKIPAALISGSVFGLLHAGTGVSAIPPLIAFGVVLALLYERTRSLGPPMLLHALNNSLALL